MIDCRFVPHVAVVAGVDVGAGVGVVVATDAPVESESRFPPARELALNPEHPSTVIEIDVNKNDCMNLSFYTPASFIELDNQTFLYEIPVTFDLALAPTIVETRREN